MPPVALTTLDDCGLVRELSPGLRRFKAPGSQQIRAVIKNTRIGEPGGSDQTPVDRVVLHQRRKHRVGCIAEIGPQIDEMRRQDTRPHDIDLQHVQIVRARGQQLEIQRQAVSR
jgi:hypothetical protein